MRKIKPIFRNSDERREWEGGEREHKAFESLAPWNRATAKKPVFTNSVKKPTAVKK